MHEKHLQCTRYKCICMKAEIQCVTFPEYCYLNFAGIP